MKVLFVLVRFVVKFGAFKKEKLDYCYTIIISIIVQVRNIKSMVIVLKVTRYFELYIGGVTRVSPR